MPSGETQAGTLLPAFALTAQLMAKMSRLRQQDSALQPGGKRDAAREVASLAPLPYLTKP